MACRARSAACQVSEESDGGIKTTVTLSKLEKNDLKEKQDKTKLEKGEWVEGAGAGGGGGAEVQGDR